MPKRMRTTRGFRSLVPDRGSMRTQNKKYVVDAMQGRAKRKPSSLQNATNAASRFRADVSADEIDNAILQHCKTSAEQLAALKIQS